MKQFIQTTLLISLLFLLACSGKKEEKKPHAKDEQKAKLAYRQNIKATVDLICYDQYTYETGKLKGALIGPNLIATPFKEIQEAYSVRSIHRGNNVEPMMNGYYTYNIPGNLVILKMSGPPMSHPKLALKTDIHEKLYRLGLKDGKMIKQNLLCDSLIQFKGISYYRIRSNLQPGIPLFNEHHFTAGVTTELTIDDKPIIVLIPAQELQKEIKNLPKKVERLGNLRFKTDKVYPKPDNVDYFRVHTDIGSFDIKLSNKLPDYQTNFIRLASDGYYDSLLIHRVLYQFLVQTGAADTRHAKKDDPVGWKGPGYTMPTKIIPGLYHKRGAIAASKLPDYKNPNNRSDGSQFYIVCGRVFSDDELNDIEVQKGITFSKAQRKLYRTVGGAPYLDGEYTVFGEVIRGMEVVDALSILPTRKDDRPFQDIRIKQIEIVMK